MTSEEMNRAFEFIIQHQAQLAIEMEDIAKLHKRMEQFTLTISELIVIESGRLDRADKQLEIQQDHLNRADRQLEIQQQRLERTQNENRDIGAMLDIQQRRLDQAEQENRAAQKRHEESQQRQEQLMQELRDRLHRIFDKLS